jgi:hypothetical protein
MRKIKNDNLRSINLTQKEFEGFITALIKNALRMSHPCFVCVSSKITKLKRIFEIWKLELIC